MLPLTRDSSEIRRAKRFRGNSVRSLVDLLFRHGGGRFNRRRNGAAQNGSDLIDDGAKVVVDSSNGGEIWFRGWDVARQNLNPDGEKTRGRRLRIDGNTLSIKRRSIHRDDGESEG